MFDATHEWRRLAASVCFLVPGGAVLAQADSLPWQRVRVAWLGSGSDPVLAQACIGHALPAPGPDENEVAAGGRFVPGPADGIARLDLFPAMRSGNQKVPAGEYAVLLQREDDGWSLVLVDGSVLVAENPKAAALGGTVRCRLPLREIVPEGRGPSGLFHFNVQQPGQERSDAWLRVQFGGKAYEATLTFDGAKQPPLIPQGPVAASCLRHDGVTLACLDHGEVKWREAFTKEMDGLQRNARWRLGSNWWTSLDTRAPLSIGGVILPVGRWHLVLSRGKGKEDWHLVCLAAADTLRAGLDAMSANATKGGIVMPLSFQRGQPEAKTLAVGFRGAAGGNQLVIRFGEYSLAAEVAKQ